MKILSRGDATTYAFLFILLAARISISLAEFIDSYFLRVGAFPIWFGWVKTAFPWLYTSYTSLTFVLIAIVLLLNQDHLQRLNIDKPFIFFFLYSGLAIFLQHILDFGCLAGIATFLFSMYALSKNNLKFGRIDPKVWRISLISIGIFAVCYIALSSFLNLPKIAQNINLFFFETIPDSVFEEVIYRGMLWMFLKNLNWSEFKIFFFQAFLFWISHINYLFENPFNFWIFIPAVSLLLGYIVLRSKSITPSIVVHLLINLLYGLILLSI